MLGIESPRTLTKYENGLAFPQEEKLDDFIRCYKVPAEKIPYFKKTYTDSKALHDTDITQPSPVMALRKEKQEIKKMNRENFYPAGINTRPR